MKKGDNYIPYLDGLRGFAIIFVILSHMGLDKVVPGGFGVSLFFFISGLLITKLLISEYEKRKAISLRNFYLRRILRLYPALVFMVCVAVIIIIVLHGVIHKWDILSVFFYFVNYYLVYFKPLPVLPTDYIFDPVWSLSVEEHFYLFFPLIFSLFYPKKDLLLKLLFVLSFLVLAYRCYLVFNAGNIDEVFENKIYELTTTRADSIIWGCIAALLIYKINYQPYLKFLRSRFALITGLAMALFSLLVRDMIFRETLRFTLQALAFMLIVPSIEFYPDKSVVRRLLENKILLFIGRLSYSIYLFQYLVIILVTSYCKLYSLTWIIAVLFFTLVISSISYYLVEQPFIALRRKFGSHAQ